MEAQLYSSEKNISSIDSNLGKIHFYTTYNYQDLYYGDIFSAGGRARKMTSPWISKGDITEYIDVRVLCGNYTSKVWKTHRLFSIICTM